MTLFKRSMSLLFLFIVALVFTFALNLMVLSTARAAESRNTTFETALKAIYQHVVDTGLGNGFPSLDVYLYTHVEA